MTPITGPLIEESGKVTVGPSPLYLYRKKYQQAKPYDLPLPYYRKTSRISSMGGVAVPNAGAFSNASYNGLYDNVICNGATIGASSEVTSTITQAKNLVFEKIISELDEKVELLVSLAERREAFEMVEKRLVQLVRVVKALRHPTPEAMQQLFPLFFQSTGGRFGDKVYAKSTWNYYIRNWRSATKDLGRTWLEFHFGWEPIVRDIDTCLQLLSQPLSGASIEVLTPRFPVSYEKTYTRSNPYSCTAGEFSGYVRANATCQILIDNESKAYRSVLGLNNPVLTAYSLIPYTWMFDWVNTLGSYISQFSALSGYKVTNASHGVKVVLRGAASYEYPRGTMQRTNTWSCETFERIVGIPSVAIAWRPFPKRLSVIRGATLASLLAGLFDPRDPINRERVPEFRKLQPI